MERKPNDTKSLAIAAARSLVIDMTNKAKSGHPGMALDVAPAMVALFQDHLVADPKHPDWVNRDRFVLSSGHVSALLYATLHLAGYDLSMDDLKSFRQLGSKTPGHPEYKETPGVDATSGPLGQGIAQAVGMAMAEEAIRAQYPGADGVFGHYTYCLCGDGCLQEGISQEAISLAGHHRLSRLILLCDLNGATLDGPTSDAFSENLRLRFLASEWNVLEVKDGNDVNAISKAISKAKKQDGYPTAILIHSVIGYGAPKQGSHKTHGSPLGEADGSQAKSVYGYPYPDFTVPDEVYSQFANTFGKRGEAAYRRYQATFQDFQAKELKEAQRYLDAFEGNFVDAVVNYPAFDSEKAESTRSLSGKCLKALHDAIPCTFGGSADVAGSTLTNIEGEPMFDILSRQGRDVHWGIREFAMAACCNGIALHGGLLPYASCFLVFSDYMKPAIRMAALQSLPVAYLFTHDSIAVGEDGPTHQPIEHLAMLRSVPNLEVVRPADYVETIGAYENIRLERNHPTALVLTRQNVAPVGGNSVEGARKGGYLAYKPKGATHLILATGSEVALCVKIAKALNENGSPVAVASLPSVSRFLSQSEKYVNSVLFLPRDKRISVEMASTFGWASLAKHNIGIDGFGASGKAGDVIASYGFDEEGLRKKVEEILRLG
ncbi:MAG: transketolase [Bacilli bacterium]|nr:transketolase [Bacilli bacterium]